MPRAEEALVQKALVVTPTYNEAGNIGKIIPQVLAVDPRIQVLVVDDGSPDGTAGIVKEMMKAEPRIHLVERPGKMGLGTAYVMGFKYALENGFDCVFEMDADFSHQPVELPKFLEAIEKCDLVIGSRYLNGVRVLNWPMDRLLLSYSANVYTRILTGLPLHDATGGFKCYRRRVLEAIDLDRIKSNGYAFQIEMSFKVWKKGFVLQEIPITFHDRAEGNSKMSKHIIYEAFFMLWKLVFRNLVGKL